MSAGGRWQFIPGVSYRNLLIYRGGDVPPPFTADTRATPPHDLTDKSVLGRLSARAGQRPAQSTDERQHRPVCAIIRSTRLGGKQGKPPATNIWLWGQGRTPAIRPFVDVYGKRGAMITAVDLLRGLAKLLGWKCIEVPGATGYLDTDYAAKGRYAVAALADTDLVCVHVEATDEASHEGRADAKIEALEQIDRHIVAPLAKALAGYGEYRILVTPDHPTPLRTKTHSHGAVPFVIAGTGIAPGGQTYDEVAAARVAAGVRRWMEIDGLLSGSSGMSLIVQKFGGTSVADSQKILGAARSAIRARQEGNDVLVVVSAMGKNTDLLIDLAREITDEPPAREMDMLLSTGEQVSVALMAMAIHSLGHQAISLTGAQIGIKTDSTHTKARIQSISTERIAPGAGRRQDRDRGRLSGDRRGLQHHHAGPRRQRHHGGGLGGRARRRRLRNLHRRRRRLHDRPARCCPRPGGCGRSATTRCWSWPAWGPA